MVYKKELMQVVQGFEQQWGGRGGQGANVSCMGMKQEWGGRGGHRDSVSSIVMGQQQGGRGVV